MPDDLMARLNAAVQQPQSTSSPIASNSSAADDSGQDLMNRLVSATNSKPVKMVGPSGSVITTTANNVQSYRRSNFMVSPDNPGVSKLVTPAGRITYALPDEVNDFVKSGHTLINKDGTFNVAPLPGEYNTDTMNRATKVMGALSDAEKQKAIDNESHPYDPRPTSMGGSGIEGVGRLATAGVAAPVAATAVTGTALAGGAELLGAGQAALGETELYQLYKSSPALFREYALNQAKQMLTSEATRQAGLQILKKVGTGVAVGAGLKWFKDISKLFE
jgi:hypothetical protein